MTQPIWTAVDDYLDQHYLEEDPVLDDLLRASDAAGLPEINVAPNQDKMLMMFAMMVGAKRILEIGTLGGYSTVWLARALPADGKLITLEYEPTHAEVARANIARAGYADQVTVRQGLAVNSLAQLQQEGQAPFDLVFIDADKPNNTNYVRGAIALSRPGTLIIVDNVVRNGEVIQAGSDDESVQGVRAMNEFIANEPRLTAAAVQTVGSKGYDGFALLLVAGE